MKEELDLFSRQSGEYKKFRPTYPESFYQALLDQVGNIECALDCGTGNGQVALRLAEMFDQVYAIDISAKQIDHAPRHPNIQYQHARSEKTGFPDHTFDLITCAQAIHWFDFQAFNQEVKRVLRPGGILAIWGYGLPRIHAEVDELVDYFYSHTMGPFWNSERRHIESAYRDIPFPFVEIPWDSGFSIDVLWRRQDLIGFLNTWSSLQNYLKQSNAENPMITFSEHLYKVWGRDEKRSVQFPMFARIGSSD